jgi:hypothetical protein
LAPIEILTGTIYQHQVPFDNSVAHQAMIIFRIIIFAVALYINPEYREAWLFRANIDYFAQQNAGEFKTPSLKEMSAICITL